MMTEEDQEDVVFDGAQLIRKQAHSSVRSTGGIYRQPAQIRKHRAARTCCLCAAFLCLGLAAAVTGPTLPYFQEQLHLDLSKIAYIYTARSFGYLSGSLAGVLFDRFGSDDLLLGCGLFVNAIGLALAPWATGLILLCCVLALTGAANGFLYAGGNVVCLRLWGARSAPYVQGLYFAIGVGAFAAPLLSAPFLGTALGYGSISTFPVAASGTAAAPGLPLALPKRALPNAGIRQEEGWPAQTSTRAANDSAVTMLGSLPGQVNLSVSVRLDIDVSTPTPPVMAAAKSGDKALDSAAGRVLFTTAENTTTGAAKASTALESMPVPAAALPPLMKPKHLDADHLSGDVGVANGVALGQRVNQVIQNADKTKEQSAVAPPIPVTETEDSRKTGSNGSNFNQTVADGGTAVNKMGNETGSLGSSTLLDSATMSSNGSVTTARAAVDANVTASLMSNSSTIPDELIYGTFMPYWLPTISNLTYNGVSSSSPPVPRAGSLVAGASDTMSAASSLDQPVPESGSMDAGGKASTLAAATLEPPVGMTLHVGDENSTGSAITQMALSIVTTTVHAGDVNGSTTVLQLTTQTKMYNVSGTIISSGNVQTTDGVFTARPEHSNATSSSSVPSSSISDAGYLVNSNAPPLSPGDSSAVTMSAPGNTDSGVLGTGEVTAIPMSKLTSDLSFKNFTATETTLDAKVTTGNPEMLHLVINTSDNQVIGNMASDGPSTGTTEQSSMPSSTHRTVASSQSAAVDITTLLSSLPGDTQVNAIGRVTSTRSTNAPELGSPAIDRHSLSVYLDDVQLLYAILSSFLTIVGLCFVYLSGSEPASSTKTPTNGAALGLAGSDTPLLVAVGASVRLMSRILALIFIVCMLYVGVEVTFGQFLSAFAMKQRGLNEQQAALLTALFWGMFAASRGLAVLASRCISAAAILCCALSAACVGLLALSFLVGDVDAGHSALWTASGLLGLGLAPVFPTIFVWTQQYLEVSGKVASVFVGGSSLGGMILPVVVGYSVQLASAMYMMYMLLGAIALSSLIYFLAWYMATGSAPSNGSRCGIRSHYEPVATEAQALDDGRMNFLGQKVSKRNTGHKGVSFQLLNEDSDKDM